jgi:hypothetical protein
MLPAAVRVWWFAEIKWKEPGRFKGRTDDPGSPSNMCKRPLAGVDSNFSICGPVLRPSCQITNAGCKDKFFFFDGWRIAGAAGQNTAVPVNACRLPLKGLSIRPWMRWEK